MCHKPWLARVIIRSKLASCTLLESDHQSFKKTGATSTKILSALLDYFDEKSEEGNPPTKRFLSKTKQLFTTKASSTTIVFGGFFFVFWSFIIFLVKSQWLTIEKIRTVVFSRIFIVLNFRYCRESKRTVVFSQILICFEFS